MPRKAQKPIVEAQSEDSDASLSASDIDSDAEEFVSRPPPAKAVLSEARALQLKEAREKALVVRREKAQIKAQEHEAARLSKAADLENRKRAAQEKADAAKAALCKKPKKPEASNNVDGGEIDSDASSSSSSDSDTDIKKQVRKLTKQVKKLRNKSRISASKKPVNIVTTTEQPKSNTHTTATKIAAEQLLHMQLQSNRNTQQQQQQQVRRASLFD